MGLKFKDKRTRHICVVMCPIIFLFQVFRVLGPLVCPRLHVPLGCMLDAWDILLDTGGHKLVMKATEMLIELVPVAQLVLAETQFFFL